MLQTLAILYQVFFVITIIAFIVSFVMIGAIKFHYHNFLEGLKDFKIARISLTILVIGVIGITSLSFTVNKLVRNDVNELIMDKNSSILIHNKGINDNLRKDLSIVPKSSHRNTGDSIVKVVVKSNSKVIKLELLRSFNDSTKYWVSSPGLSIGTIGEINTKHLKN